MANTAGTPTVIVPPEDELGEAMLALTPARRAFVIALVETGTKDQSLAAAMAGLGGTDNARRVVGSRLMRLPTVLAAIREEADRRLRSGALLAASRLYELVMSRDEKIAFKASVELMNRAGMMVETQHRVIVENDTRSAAQIQEQVMGLFKKLHPGQSVPAALAPPVDAEFEVVSSDDGIEDLLG
jgi:hypothetical protein